MTDLLGDTLLSLPPLQFTKNLAKQMDDYVIGAFSRPLPATDPLSSYRYLRSRSETLKGAFKQRPLVRMQDKNLQQLATIGTEMSCVAEEIASDTGEATVVIRGGDYLGDFVRNAVRVEEDLHLSIDQNPTRLSWKTRWGGKITTINVKRDSSGIHTVELQASAQREHLKHVLVGSTPLFPPEVQPIKMWLMPANCRTGCAITLFINLLRQFDPIASIPTNIFNPFGWVNPFGPDALLNLNPLQWPIQVQFVDPLLDQSRTTLITASWQDFHTVTSDVMKDAGVAARAYTYFTDDVDNPHPELQSLLPNTLLSDIPIVGQLVGLVESFLNNTGLAELPTNATVADLARPERNCVLVAFEDHSGYSGPTGSAADGVINLFASTLDDLITSTVFPVPDPSSPTGIDPIFEKLFLVAPPPPWAIYRDGQFSGIIESNYTQHKGPVKTAMTGGKSPKIVNDLQCVSGDSIVEGPDGNERIDILAAKGDPFRVWSITPSGERVAAWATHAFKKGTAELFEYRLDDGRAIKATHQHRFLTQAGFMHGADIGAGSKIATADHNRIRTVDNHVAVDVSGTQYENMGETAALTFREVIDLRSLGVDDFYDMHVPGWQNYSANGFWNHNTFAIRYAISQIGQSLPLVGELPGVEGLDNLYQGQLDNILLAWQRYTDPIRALYTGDVGYLERFDRPGGSAYTISSVLTLRQINWKTRAFRSFKTSIRNAAPFIIGYDILLDDRVGFEQDGILYVDQVAAIKYEYDRHKPVTYTVSVGDDTKDEDPFAQGIRAIQAVYTLIGSVVGEGTLFD